MEKSSQSTKPEKSKRRKYPIPKQLILSNTSDDVSAFGDVDDGTESTYKYSDESIDCIDSMYATSASSSVYYQQHHDFVSIRLETSFECNQSLESNQNYNDKYQIHLHNVNEKRRVCNDCSQGDFNKYNCGLELDRTKSTKETADSWTVSMNESRENKVCTEVTTEEIDMDAIQVKPSSLTSGSRKSTSSSKKSRKSDQTKPTKSQRNKTNQRLAVVAKDYGEGKEITNLKLIKDLDLQPRSALNNEIKQSVKIVAPHDLMPGCSIKINVHGKDIRAIVVSHL